MPKNISWNWSSLSNSGHPQVGWRDGSTLPFYPGETDEVSASAPQPGAAAAAEPADAKDAAALGLSELSKASVIALVGLAFEARIAAGPGVLVVCRGDGYEASELPVLAARHGCRSIISFGVAGGLLPELVPGDCVVASTIVDYPTLRAADPMWSRKLLEAIPDARHGPIVGVNSVVSDPAEKRVLHDMTGAVAVDMESHLVARSAAAHGLAFAAVRVIIDPAYRVVPPAAMLAMGPSGAADVSLMMRELLIRPWQLSALLRIAADAYAARAALIRLRRALGPGFSFG
jgi:hopanoid-associated phosphorylase